MAKCVPLISTTILAAYEDIQEGQLVVLFLLHRKLYVREDCIQTFLEYQQLIPVDNDEGIIQIPGQELRFRVFFFFKTASWDSSLASIGNVFGRDALRSARRWETFVLREASTYSQIRFLHRCLDNNVLPKCVSYKSPVNTDLARRAVFQHGRRMIRVLLQDCHARLRKYRQRNDQERTRCCEFMGEIGTNLLLQRVTEQSREQRMMRDAALENKFRKLSNPTSPRNDKLMHSLSSKELTKDQMQVLRHEASFNTTDAKPVNMIAAVESILGQTEATEERQANKALLPAIVSSSSRLLPGTRLFASIDNCHLDEVDLDVNVPFPVVDVLSCL
ncbi:hypothetical protein SprV_0702325600 [Sparganum proliferum]